MIFLFCLNQIVGSKCHRVKKQGGGVSGLLGSFQRPIAQIPLSRPNSNSKWQNSNVKLNPNAYMSKLLISLNS